jgi:hypothetical protein
MRRGLSRALQSNAQTISGLRAQLATAEAKQLGPRPGDGSGAGPVDIHRGDQCRPSARKRLRKPYDPAVPSELQVAEADPGGQSTSRS